MLVKDIILTKFFLITIIICLTQFFEKNCFSVEPDEILHDQNRNQGLEIFQKISDV